MKDWPALVLTAGLGTRLRPLSYVRAKPAIPVAGVPLVCRILASLAAQGVQRAVLNLHHKPETIRSIVGDGSALGLSVAYSWENPVLGSAGGPRQALALLDAPRFFIVNGDTLSNVALRTLAERHERSGAAATLALVAHPDPGRYGGINLDAGGRITGFVRKGTPSDYHFVGIQAASAEAFDGVPPGVPAETIGWLYPGLLAQRPDSVRGEVFDAGFYDIGTARDYLFTSLSLARAEHRELPLVGRRCSVDPSASVEDSILWDDVVVEAGAVLERCVVADQVRVPAGSRFHEAVLVRSAVASTPAPGERLEAGLLVRPF